MAILYPEWPTIMKAHQQPTEGEVTLLKFLEQNLNDEYEIYFQPYLNGDRPDVVLMRKGGGVLIFEVKDYNPALYQVDKNLKWQVKTSGGFLQPISSPFEQVNKYKRNIFELHSGPLMKSVMKNNRYLSVVNCAVFFSRATYREIEEIAITPFKNSENSSYQKYLKQFNYLEIYTADNLNLRQLTEHLDKIYISRQSRLFIEEHYNSLKRYLRPPYHLEEEGIDIIYTKDQEKLIGSEAGKRQKIKGVAGCGKTFVLAKRAVNAHLRTGEHVLILTFNISLVNYIRDRISDVKAGFERSSFHIVNYHQFFKSEAGNHGLKLKGKGDWDNPHFFKDVIGLKTYSAIFIDEVQDYKEEWLTLIHDYFLRPGGEFVIFGDEKQNIYDRELDEEKNIVTKGIPGRWNKSLTSSLRFTENIAKLAARFQMSFFSNKYKVEQIQTVGTLTLGFDNRVGKAGRIDYIKTSKDISIEEVYKTIKNYLLTYQIHPSDACIVGSTVDKLRELDFWIRRDLNERTTVTFENKEFFEEKKPDGKKLEQLRRVKKLHFNMKTGTMKLSTIHSFKGWDIPTLFLIIDDPKIDLDGFTTHELIYTAITRAKQNLVVLNSTSNQYHQFFEQDKQGKITVI